MEIDMQAQFQKLKDIVDHVEKFYFGFDREYFGPRNPTSIVSVYSESGFMTTNFLILAEGVPAMYLPFDPDSNHLEALTVYLDDKFEFRLYDPEGKRLGQLSVLVGNPEYSYDGTVSGAKAFFEKNNWTLKILFSL